MREKASPHRSIFAPAGVAVVGVSREPGKIGTRIFENIRAHGFTGAIYPVSAPSFEIDGVETFATLRAIKAPVDLVIVSVPCSSVPAVIADASAIGARAAVVISSGFAEVGEPGATIEHQITAAAAHGNVRIIGPNCFGIINGDPAVRLVATFGRAPLLGGNVAIAFPERCVWNTSSRRSAGAGGGDRSLRLARKFSGSVGY